MKKALFRELISAEYDTTQTRNHLSVKYSLYEYNGEVRETQTKKRMSN